MVATVRIGVVGWGDIARDHASHFAAAGAELAGVVSRRDAHHLRVGADVAVYRRLADMLPHVDAITVAVPNHLHGPCCLEAVRAGKPVLVEKPIAIDVAQLDELESAFKSLRAPVHVGYRLRWNPSMIELRERIRAAGNVRRIRCVYRLGIDQLADGKDWTRRLETTGGAFFALGVHTLDLARWLADAGNSALADLSATARHRDDTADFPLDVRLSGRLPNGIEITAGTDLRGDADSTIELEVDGGNKDSPISIYPNPTLAQPVPSDEPVEYAGLISNFVAATRNQSVNLEDVKATVQTHRELLAARELADSTEPAQRAATCT